MIVHPYWLIVEIIAVILVSSLTLWRIYRSTKQRGARPPAASWREKLSSALVYALRLAATTAGAALGFTIFIMIERSVYSAIAETAPVPSEVTIPPSMPFGVEEVTFESEDGLILAGWYAPSHNGATIILLHGYGLNRTAMLWHAERLVRAGYGVLMYDERASGESEGEYRSYGWEDARDVYGAIRFLETRPGGGAGRIGAAGCSIGGQIALQGAAYHPEIEAVWADGPSGILASDSPAPRNPLMALLIAGNYMLDEIYTIKLGIEPPKPMLEIIDDIAPRPIMMVGGGKPHPIIGSEAERNLPLFAEYAGGNAQTWVIPEATHCDGPHWRPEEYATRMIEFFDRAFDIERK